MEPSPPAPAEDAPAEGDAMYGPSPGWPPWFGFAGFGAALMCTLLAVALIGFIFGVEPEDEPPGLAVAATLIQGAFFVGVALVLAGSISPPRLWHFGFRRAPLWRTVGWAAVGMLAFYVATTVYALLVDPTAEQDVTESLGADEGTLGLIAAGTLVIVAAPLVEEFFFRGFFYRALRNRYPIAIAAAIDGAIFGLVHFGFEGADGLLLLPPLAFLGAVFCVVYERTGTLWAPIGMHAFNNSIAFAAQVDDGWWIAVVAGPAMLVACVLAPRLLSHGPPSLPPARPGAQPDPQLSLPIE